ncbi:hypothetical protein N7474_001279 [Penicillium riverlandense]|uniref:uncharacterized protein n=1 Tax=Penicillium riverlandense TaxID=1903569 RepID=UPI002548F66E|nr:uncharacterized protein N7474_001279 [Penicillium riverlandense]KAJ5832968.1 hypothetical protein N7474_001279 [Penicillium riverlandense]
MNRQDRAGFATVRLLISGGQTKVMEGLNTTPHWPVLSTLQASNVATRIQDQLVADYSTSVNVFVHNSALWARISGQIYLELEDFRWLAQVLKVVCAEACASLGESNAR